MSTSTKRCSASCLARRPLRNRQPTAATFQFRRNSCASGLDCRGKVSMKTTAILVILAASTCDWGSRQKTGAHLQKCQIGRRQSDVGRGRVLPS